MFRYFYVFVILIIFSSYFFSMYFRGDWRADDKDTILKARLVFSIGYLLYFITINTSFYIYLELNNYKGFIVTLIILLLGGISALLLSEVLLNKIIDEYKEETKRMKRELIIQKMQEIKKAKEQ